MNVLFICRGNVGRSVMAQGIFNKLATDKHSATSAGTQLSGPEQPLHELSPAVDNVLTVMEEEGIDVSNHIRTQVTKQMMATTDKVVLVTDDNDPIPDYLLNNHKTIQWNIADPKKESLEFHRKTKNEIKNLVQGLVKDL